MLGAAMYQVSVLQQVASFTLIRCSLKYLPGTNFDTIHTSFDRISNMEIYRTLNGPFPGCPSYGILQRMYEIALPELRNVDGVPVDIAHASLEALHERDSKMFFPQGALEDILDEDTIREVLNCDGKNCCGRAREKNLSNFKVLVTWVFRNARILLAVLIYLGRTSQINTFRERSIGDDEIHKGVSFISKQQPVGSSLAFANFYEKTLDLFKPPIFVMGNPTFAYDDNQRFPYIHDEECGKGSFGKVRRFEIHPVRTLFVVASLPA
jgi:hypothetical protein